MGQGRRSRSIVRALVPLGLLLTGCASFGPQYLQESRLQYNEVVKTSSEEQLLLNIVRLRYGDTPSSLAVSSVAAQFELAKSFQLTPFFVASGAAAGSYAAVLPQLSLSGTDRPTISLTPADDQEFTRKLFTPLPLDGLIYLAKTTWPIATVFRLYLENLNWVPNAQTASGPTPRQAPAFEDFLQGVLALEAAGESVAGIGDHHRDVEVRYSGHTAVREVDLDIAARHLHPGDTPAPVGG